MPTMMHHEEQRVGVTEDSGLAALSRFGALAAGGRHIPPRAGLLARRLCFLGLSHGRPCLIHGGRGDSLSGVLRSATLLEVRLDVVVLTLALFGPGTLWHRRHLPCRCVQAACEITRRIERDRVSADRQFGRRRYPAAARTAARTSNAPAGRGRWWLE